MPEYRNNSFKKGFSRNSPPGGRPGAGSSGERFKAECSKCHKSCDVPFRPNGKKPVFCSNCFVRDTDRDSRDSRDTRGAYQRNDYAPARTFAPKPQPQQEDRRIDDLKRQLAAIDGKLDALIEAFEATRLSATIHEVMTPAAPAKPKAGKETKTGTKTTEKAKAATAKKKAPSKKTK